MIKEDLIIAGMANCEVSKLDSNVDEKATAVLAAEKEFRDACEQALGTRTVTYTILNLSQDAEEMSGFIERALKLLGLNRPVSNGSWSSFEDLFHILLPVKRIDYLMLSAEARLRAILLASELARINFNTVMMPTLSNLSSYFDTVNPLLAVLGLGKEPFEPLMNWQADGKRPPLDSADQKIAFGSMILLTGKGYGTLQALEEALSTVSRPLERVLFIRRLAALLRQNAAQDSSNEEGKQPAKVNLE